MIAPRPAAAAAPVELCSPGAVLRAFALVDCTLVLLALATGASTADWAPVLLRDMAVAQPVVALWIVGLCAATRLRLLRDARTQAWVAPAGAAALTWLAQLVQGRLLAPDAAPTPDWRGAALGALLAALLLQHQRLRAQALDPAHTRARLDELQARIRPHFLYNALNAASALVHDHPQRAEQVLDDLASLFRASVGRSGHISTVRDELELTRRYLDIEDVRFGPRLRLYWDVEPSSLDARMPALTLQPLLENAVRHGVESMSRPCRIDVAIRRRGGHLEVDVSNDFEARAHAAAGAGTGVALANIEQRLRLLYDLDAHLRHGPQPGDGDGAERWGVHLRIPA